MPKFNVTFECEGEQNTIVVPVNVDVVVEAPNKQEAVHNVTKDLLRSYDRLNKGKITVKEVN